MFNKCWVPSTYSPPKKTKKASTRAAVAFPSDDRVIRYSIVDPSNGKLVSREDDDAGWNPRWTKRVSEARSWKTKKEARSYVSSCFSDKQVVIVKVDVTLEVGSVVG